MVELMYILTLNGRLSLIWNSSLMDSINRSDGTKDALTPRNLCFSTGLYEYNSPQISVPVIKKKNEIEISP